MTPFDPDIEEMLSQAEALLQDQRPIEALSLLDRAGKLAPRHAWATLYRGVALGQLGKVDEAIAMLLSAADNHPDDLDIQIDSAWHMTLLDFPQDALVTIERALKLDTHDSGAVLVYAEILERLNRITEAVNVREEQLLRHPEDEENRLLLAMDMCDTGRYSEALELACPLISANPQDPDIVRLHGACLSYQGNHEEAAVLWEKLEALEGPTQNLLHNRACTLDALLRHEEALEIIDLAIEKEPETALNHFTRGMINEHLGKLELAVIDYLNAITRDHDFMDAVVNLAEVAEHCQMVSATLVCVEELLTEQPADEPPCAVLLYARGLLLLQMNRVDDARVTIEEAVRCEPDLGYAWHTLSIIYQMHGESELLIMATERALRTIPDDGELLTMRGMAFTDCERYADALECFDTIMRINPEDPEPLIQMGRIFLNNLGRTSDARAVLRGALQLEPRNHQALWMLALCHLRLGELDSAEVLVDCIRANPKQHYYGQFVRAAYHAQKGEIDAAFATILEMRNKDDYAYLLQDPLFQPLAVDARYYELGGE